MPEGVNKRKPHTKSRKGCLQCKTRHTKCNEAHPRCANCIRLDIDCIWPNYSTRMPQLAHPGHHVSMAMEQRNFSSPESSLGVPTAALAVEDLRLLHHFTLYTSTSLRLGPSSQRMWQVNIVEIGFEHPFLLHGILALAAIHKAIVNPQSEGKTMLLQAADSHISNALGTYRKHLEEPTLETCVPMFLLSSILVTYNLASAQLEEPEDPISALEHCFRLLQGVKVVIEPHWNALRESEIFQIMSAPARNTDDSSPNGPELSEILHLHELASIAEEEDKESYKKAVEDLHSTFIRVRRCFPQDNQSGVIFVWPTVLHTRFLDMISTQHPVAVVLLAYFAVMMSECRFSWWIKGWPERIMRAAQQLIESTPHLKVWLDWPLHNIQDWDQVMQDDGTRVTAT